MLSKFEYFVDLAYNLICYFSFGFYKLSKAPGSFNRKVSLAIDMYEAKFCLDKADEGSEN